MKSVAETEAETQLPSLLDEVELGAEIAITRDGKPIAMLTPIVETRARYAPEVVRAAMVSIREQARLAGQKFDWEEVKAWREEGRH